MSEPSRKVVLCCVGTRPEAIKMAPVIRAFQSEAHWADCRVLVTAQHRELVDEVLAFFGLVPHVDLDAMRPSQSLAELTARLVVGLDEVLASEAPDLVVAQGDTTTVLATALACFYRRVSFAHVEAGLRTHRLDTPFPEEANRILVGQLARLHLAPTAGARANLLREGIPDRAIHVTGNSVVDALFLALERRTPIGLPLDPDRRLILVTAHRRDSFGKPLRDICHAVATISERCPDVEVLWPVHPNPAVRSVVEEMLGGKARIRLCEPLTYGRFVSAMQRAYLILTDSGGVQEEAPALCKPVIVMREESERPEGVQAGAALLVGTDMQTLVRTVIQLLSDEEAYSRMCVGASPYGDGQAAARIVQAARTFLDVPAAGGGRSG